MIFVRAAIDEGDSAKAIVVLRPYLESGNAEAEYLYASCPVAEEPESVSEQRHLQYVESAARKGYPPAQYLMGAYLDSGDFVAQDKRRASDLFAKAAAAGHLRSKWIHGEDLLYGRNGVVKNANLGLELIRVAAEEKLGQAMETVASFLENGLHGYPKDRKAALALRASMAEEHVIIG